MESITEAIQNALFPPELGLLTVAAYAVIGALIYRALQSLFFSTPKLGWQQERNLQYNARVTAQKRRVKTYPGYPNGWYKVANIWEMKPGEIISTTLCGKDVIVYKSEDKKKHDVAFVIDAYCPHLGAHLGDGKVRGDCIECPFHGWVFDGEGKCTSIPYSPAAPPKEAAMSHKWHQRISNGMLLAWYDVDGNDPAYEPEAYSALSDRKKYRYSGEMSGRVSMHIQDFVENGADYAHFAKLHGVMMAVPFFGTTILGIDHQVTWETVPEKGHQSLFKDYASVTFRGKIIKGSGALAEILIDGCGGIMHFHFSTPIGDIHIIQTSTPVAPCLSIWTMQFFSMHTVPRLLARYICHNWESQAVNDFIIWENKEYTAKPVLVKGDGPIMQMRRWYQQFYSDSSNFLGATTSHDIAW